MFDPETYDPFKHHESNREVHQRINGVNSQIGAPAVLDWAEIDAMAETIAATTFFGRISQLDNDAEAKALAMQTIQMYRLHVESQQLVGHTWIADHAGTQHDWHDPHTTNRLYALLAFDPKMLIPLSHHYRWQDVADKYLSRYRVCDVAVSLDCAEHAATETMAIKSGEFVCIYRCCVPCRVWFNDPDREHFRRREFSDDFWDRR